VRPLLVVLLLVGVACGTSAAATAPRPPATLRAGESWTAVVSPRQPKNARWEIRLGARRVTFPLRRGPRSSTARVVFPAAGTWTYGLRNGTRFRRLGAATIRPRRLILGEPFDIVHAGGGLVITDRRAGAVFFLVPETGAWRRVARIPQARELAVVDGHAVLVTSGARILRLDLSSGATEEVARVNDVVLGLERGADGALYVSEGGSTIVSVAPAGGRRVVAAGRDGVHGLLLDGSRLVAAESYAGNVLAIDLATNAVSVLASRLGNPSFAVPAPGGLYVSEFAAGRISLLGTNGSVRGIAAVPAVGPLALAGDGTLIAATITGELVRVDPRRGTVRPLVP
jgi:hypothetical protein